jgi:hypothetical protein
MVKQDGSLLFKTELNGLFTAGFDVKGPDPSLFVTNTRPSAAAVVMCQFQAGFKVTQPYL